MAKNKQSNLIANLKMLNIGVINKDTINLGKGGEGDIQNYSELPIIRLKSLFICPPPQLFFSINCIRNRILHVRFSELYNFIIY